MKFVLDASVTVSWVLPDEQSPVALRAERLLKTGTSEAVVPTLWWYEVRNILVVSERRRRITPAGTSLFLNELEVLPITAVSFSNDSAVLDLSRQFGLTVYDASYLALAIQIGTGLATLDEKLMETASSLAVPLLK